MRIKLFEELKKETYLSAADKLRSKGHIKRADSISAMAYRHIDRMDPNKYNINFKNNDIEIDGVFQIVDIVESEGETPLIYLQCKGIKICICYGELDKHRGFWIRQTEPNVSINNWTSFKFKIRKDARNFKNFLVDQFPEFKHYAKISINDMYI